MRVKEGRAWAPNHQDPSNVTGKIEPPTDPTTTGVIIERNLLV
jgi:hypothetical protein